MASVVAITALVPATALGAGAPGGSNRQTPPPGHALLYLPGTIVLDGQRVTVPHRAVHVLGVAWPYAPGQWIGVRAYLGGRLIKAREVRLERLGHGNGGEFQVTMFSPGAGTLVVTASHVATSQLGAFSVKRGLAALDARAGFGARGRFIELIQQRLAALHFYIPQTGTYDEGTGLALGAYHRLLRSGTSQSLDGATTNALLDGYGTFKVRFPRHGRHAEGNLSLQLLALISGSRVEQIYPISSGKPSTPTILGDFHVYMKDPGYLPDGMYFSNFFHNGYAIHGYNPAPDYPASHGCMRLPIVDAISVFRWLAIGDWVDTYY